MSSLDLIGMGFKNLFRRKVRTFLTVLGVVIGTASIVVMLSLGIGMNESYDRQIKQMGSLNVITVDPYFRYEGDGPSMGGPPKTTTLDDKAVLTFSNIKGVEAVTPVVEVYPKFVSGKYVGWGQLIGIDIRTMEAFDFKVAEGMLPADGDVDAVVFGTNVARNFYNPKARGGYYWDPWDPNAKPLVNPMTDKIQMTFDMSYGEKQPIGGSPSEPNKKPAKLFKLKVVGVLQQSNDEKDYRVYMDINQVKKYQKEAEKANSGGSMRVYRGMEQQQGYQQVLVKVKNINDVDRVQTQIKEMGFGTWSLSDIRKSMQKQAATVQTILGGIGAISLLVAALGITNTMVMSIYERTREIGIMKVLGCIISDIRRLFLFEAGMIGFLGGAVGIAFSYGASFLVNKVGAGFMNRGGMYYMPGEATSISIIPLWLALASIGFATIVGLVSGFYPARRAMKLSALEAIKTE